MKLGFYLYNVFAQTPLGGNPLAIFDPVPDLSDFLMQALARQMNLSETLFQFPAKDPNHLRAVRIFTPQLEIPFAGHPLLGAAWHLGAGQANLVLETPAGNIAFERQDEDLVMTQPPARFGSCFQDHAALAALLGLKQEDFRFDLPWQVVATGLPFLLVPLANLNALGRIQPNWSKWSQVFAAFETPHLFCYAPGPPGYDYQTRVFVPSAGIQEDPATGSAHGPFAAFLEAQGVLGRGQGMMNLQGVEMKRPSLIKAWPGLPGPRVGGQATLVGQGWLEIEPD